MKKFRLEHSILLGLCGFLLALAVTTDYHRVVDYLFSDEAVYYLMAQSLAFDRDIEYTRQDLQRVYEEGWDAGPQGVYLTKAEDGKIYYGKYLTYSLFLAPFIAAFGFKGFLILNVLLLCLMIWMGWVYLRQFNPQTISLLIALTFFLLSASFVYTFWLTPEMFNMFCVTSGLFLWLYRREEVLNGEPPSFELSARIYRHVIIFIKWLSKSPEGRLYLAPIPIAIACASKITNVFFLAPILADVLLKGYPGRYKIQGPRKPLISRLLPFAMKILMLCVVFGIFAGMFFGLQYKMTGHFNQYAGDRRMFIRNFPFSTPSDTWDRGIQHSTQTYFERSHFLTLKTFFYNIYYYLFGRFTGMFPYFICSFLALYYFVRQVIVRTISPLQKMKSLRRLVLLLTIGGSISTYIVMAPINYHGGTGAFGNRFFLNIYPAFLFLISTVFQRGKERYVSIPLVISWIVGSLFLAQALLNPFQTSYYPAAPAFKFPYRFLPVELTMINALPTLINPRLMQVENDKDLPYRLYFFDENATDMSPREFWVQGEKTVELAVRPFNAWVQGEKTAEPVVRPSKSQEVLAITITNGPIENRVDLSVAGTTQSIRFEIPGQQKRFAFPLKWSMPYFTSFLYPVKIRSHTGFVPKFAPETELSDPRYLGCRVNISRNPLEVGRAYLENGKPQEALAVLEPIVKKQPNDIQAWYYLGLAYHQVGMKEAAINALERGKSLLPDLQITKSYEAEDLSRTTGTVVEQPNASDGKVVEFNPAENPPGFVVYGQYTTFPAGQYQARYRIKVGKPGDTHSGQSGIALFFDVYSPQYGVVKKDSVTAEEGEYDRAEEYREYTLNFEIASQTTLEFRVKTTGYAQVSVDRIDVYPHLPLQIYQALARAKSSIGDYEDAYQYLQQATAIDPWTLELQIDFLQVLLKLKQWDNALQFAKNTGRFSSTHTGIVTYLDPQLANLSFDFPDAVTQFYNDIHASFTPKTLLVHNFEDKLAFIGYDLVAEKIVPGDQFSIRYYWKSLKAMDENYAIFVHFTKKGKILAPEIASKVKRKFRMQITDMFQQDHQPVSGAYPTSKWIAHELIREQYNVTVPPEIEPGTYEIWVGVWNPLTQTRLKTDGKTIVKIGEIQIN
jgi:tetratricopeptide (TPR) repeat protein